MTRTADELVAIAMGEVGNLEGPNTNENKYCKELGLPMMDWCGVFAKWCLRQAGFTVNAGGANGAEPDPQLTTAGARGYRAAGRWSTNDPQPGDLVFFDWAGGGGIEAVDHVGIVVAVDASTITAIEGNAKRDGAQVQGVFPHKRPRNNQIVGYGRPRFDGGAATAVVERRLPADPPLPPGPPTPPEVLAAPGWPPYPGEAKVGADAAIVRVWQRILIQAGAIRDVPENNDGVFGTALKNKVDNLQRGWGWPPDSKAGPGTYRMITGLRKA